MDKLIFPEILEIKQRSEIFKSVELAFLNPDFLFFNDFVINILKELQTGGVSGFSHLYAGHQHNQNSGEKDFNILGDGRVININIENYTRNNPNIRDKTNLFISLKGIGPTALARENIPYSDGYMTSEEAIREYTNSETLYSFNIQTERIIAILKTNQKVKRYNQDKKIEELHDGAIVIRANKYPVIRIGTLEYLAHNNNYKNIKSILMDSPILSIKNNILQNFQKAHNRGFVHNILNTDNISIFGEIIDVGYGEFYTKEEIKNIRQSVIEEIINIKQSIIEEKEQNLDIFAKDNQDLDFAFRVLSSIENIIYNSKD